MAKIDDATYSYEKIETDLLEEIYKEFPYDEIVDDADAWQRSKNAKASELRTKSANIVRPTKTSNTAVKGYIKPNTWGTIFEGEKDYIKAAKQGLLTATPTKPSNSLSLNRMYNNKETEMLRTVNLTRTTALQSANKEFLDVVNKAFIDMKNGTSYQTATRKATKELADKGITGQTYVSKNGRVTTARVQDAVRRELITSTSQLAGEMQMERNREWGNNHVEVDSHSGSRPDHAEWQGAIYSVEGSTLGYKNLASVTDYGSVSGLKGANCAHSFYPFVVGISKQRYEPYDLDENEQQYKDIQGMRYQERNIRKRKEQLIRDNKTGDKESFVSNSKSLKAQNKALKQYKADKGLMQTSRTSVVGFDRKLSGQVTTASNTTGKVVKPKTVKKPKTLEKPKFKKAESKPVVAKPKEVKAKSTPKKPKAIEKPKIVEKPKIASVAKDKQYKKITELKEFEAKNGFTKENLLDRLSLDEAKAVDHYTGIGYRTNTNLRSGVLDDLDDKAKHMMKHLDTALENTTLKENIKVYRAIGVDDDTFKGLLKGNTLKDNGYMSTSTKQSYGKSFRGKNVVVEIDVPAGTKGLYINPISRMKRESEFLMPRGVELEIKEIIYGGDKKHTIVKAVIKQ